MNSRETVTFQELTPQQFETVRPLFAGFDSSLSIHAAIEGNSPGRIFVDNVEWPRTHRPGEVYSYSSCGYDLAALIAEEVSGVPFDQNIFKPLGMTHSRYALSRTKRDFRFRRE